KGGFHIPCSLEDVAYHHHIEAQKGGGRDYPQVGGRKVQDLGIGVIVEDQCSVDEAFGAEIPDQGKDKGRDAGEYHGLAGYLLAPGYIARPYSLGNEG